MGEGVGWGRGVRFQLGMGSQVVDVRFGVGWGRGCGIP